MSMPYSITPSEPGPSEADLMALHGNEGTSSAGPVYTEPLPDLTGSHPLQVRVAAGLQDDGEHIAAMNMPPGLLDDMGPADLNVSAPLMDDGSPEPS
jgi:hypothetical protein